MQPGLGFFRLAGHELDALDWAHHVTLVRPGKWAKQYKAWLPARAALTRIEQEPGREQRTMAQYLRQGVHQFLDDAEYAYRGLRLHLPDSAVGLRADDPCEQPVAVESVGEGAGEVLVMRRLGSVLDPRPSAPELVLRGLALRAGQLAG